VQELRLVPGFPVKPIDSCAFMFHSRTKIAASEGCWRGSTGVAYYNCCVLLLLVLSFLLSTSSVHCWNNIHYHNNNMLRHGSKTLRFLGTARTRTRTSTATLLWSTTDRPLSSSSNTAKEVVKPRASGGRVYEEATIDVTPIEKDLNGAFPEQIINGGGHHTRAPLNSELAAIEDDDSTATTPVEPPKTVDDYPSIEAFLEDQGIQSRPKEEGGMWDVKHPLRWTENFGRRSAHTQQLLDPNICLKPGDEGYFDVSDMQVPGCAIVRTKEEAAIVLEKLYAADKDIFHACDT